MAQRYDTYKDSGVQWLGEIPRHWNRALLGKLAILKTGTTPEFFENELGNETIDWYTPSDFKDDFYLTDSQRRLNKEDFDGCGLSYFPANSVLIIGIGGTAGKVACNKNSCYSNQQITSLIIKGRMDPLYMMLYLRSIRNMLLKTAHFTTLPILNNTFLAGVYVPLPPLFEQHSIVSYLDDKCGKIDKMLEGKQKQIELLAEMKQRIIADAVTRGINPDVELKESGIFWIRHVPSHWNVRRLGHVLRKENRERPINAELLVCTNKAKVIKRGESKMGLIADSEDVYQGVKKGDLLIHGMDTWHGAIAISEYDGMCTPVVHVCTSNEDVGFISLYLRYMAMMKVFKLISNGVRQNTSDFRSWGKVAVIPCPLPPLDEQHAIVSYITDKTSKIDTLTSKLQQEIESIKEYKQRLISDVVTGQIKVC